MHVRWFIRARQVSDYFANSVPPNTVKYGRERLNWMHVCVTREDQKDVHFYVVIDWDIFFHEY